MTTRLEDAPKTKYSHCYKVAWLTTRLDEAPETKYSHCYQVAWFDYKRLENGCLDKI